MSEDILGFPGRYILEKVELEGFSGDTLDIIDMVSSISYVEDLFSPCVYGTCTVFDGVDISQYLPICGEEFLRLVYRTAPSEPEIDKTFQVYKVGNKQTVSNSREQYTIYFCSPELISDRRTRISKSYKDFKTNEIVQDIFDSFLETEKSLTLDESLESLHLIIPNLTPFETIQFCSAISRSTVSEGALYTFFEDRDGFRFSNIESLFSGDLITDDPVKPILQSTQGGDELFPSVSLANYQIKRASKDLLASMMDGVFANQTFGIDLLTRTFVTEDYNYHDDFDSTIHLNTSRLTSDSFESTEPTQRISVQSTQSQRRLSSYFKTNSNESLYPVHESISGKRTAQLGQLDTIIVKGTLYGLTRVTVGKTVELDIPNHTQLEDKKQNPSDKYMAGKYLITNCVHTLTPTTYTVETTFMKDTLNSDLEYDLD